MTSTKIITAEESGHYLSTVPWQRIFTV